MANYKVVDADQLDADMATVADAIRSKAGTEDALRFPDGFVSAVEGIEVGGAAEVYYSDMGQMYTPHMVVPGDMRYVRDHFNNATHLVSYAQKNGTPNLDSDYGLFSGCSALEEVWVARSTFGNYCFRLCTSLKDVTLGRVGLAVTRLDSIFDNYVTTVERITCYVNAETIAEIPTSVTKNIVPYMCPNATIIYRNSTTGEVITE